MSSEKIRILITNDDGYHSEGIIALENALSEIGDCYVVAPATEMSGASHSLTLSRPLRIRRIDARHWTVDGALEATILGVPGLAFSLVASRSHDFTESIRIAKEITRQAIDEGLPENTLLNINVPKGVPRGFRITKQGFKDARPVISEHIDPRGKAYYWISEERNGFHAEGGTDFEAIDEGFVSVTPMRSDLTNHKAIDLLKKWETMNLRF